MGRVGFVVYMYVITPLLVKIHPDKSPIQIFKTLRELDALMVKGVYQGKV